MYQAGEVKVGCVLRCACGFKRPIDAGEIGADDGGWSVGCGVGHLRVSYALLRGSWSTVRACCYRIAGLVKAHLFDRRAGRQAGFRGWAPPELAEKQSF